MSACTAPCACACCAGRGPTSLPVYSTCRVRKCCLPRFWSTFLGLCINNHVQPGWGELAGRATASSASALRAQALRHPEVRRGRPRRLRRRRRFGSKRMRPCVNESNIYISNSRSAKKSYSRKYVQTPQQDRTLAWFCPHVALRPSCLLAAACHSQPAGLPRLASPTAVCSGGGGGGGHWAPLGTTGAPQSPVY